MLVLIIAALTQPAIELHVCGNAESRLLLRALNTDIPVICEDTRAIRHYQDELRQVARIRQSLDV